MILKILKNTFKWDAPRILIIESFGLIICTILAIIMWLSAKSNYKMQEKLLTKMETQHKQNNNANTTKKRTKSIVFEEEGQVTVTKEKRSSLSLDTLEHFDVAVEKSVDKEIDKGEIEGSDSGSVSSLKSVSYNIAKLGGIQHLKILSNHLRKLFTNPIFIIIIIVGFCYDGTIVCFSGILKRLLEDKFLRKEGKIAVEMGFTKYFGLLAPFAGHIIDRVRNREWFMFTAGVCLVFSTFSLVLCDGGNIILLYIALFGISFGQVCYGNSFWPSIASIAGRKYQIVAYGFMGCITSIGAVIIPLICAQFADHLKNIIVACVVFAILTTIGLCASIVIIIINNTCFAEIDYINRHLSSPKISDTGNTETSVKSEETEKSDSDNC